MHAKLFVFLDKINFATSRIQNSRDDNRPGGKYLSWENLRGEIFGKIERFPPGVARTGGKHSQTIYNDFQYGPQIYLKSFSFLFSDAYSHGNRPNYWEN